MARKLIVLLTAFSHLMAFNVRAEEHTSFYSPVTAAKYSALFVNESKTFEMMFKRFAPFFSKDENAGVEQILKKYNLANAKLPKCKAEKNIVNCEGAEYTFTNEKTVLYKGHVFAYKQDQAFDTFLSGMIARFDQRTSGWQLIPDAHAIAPLLLAFVVIGASFATAGAIVGTLYTAISLWDWYKDGSVTCRGNDFLVRKRAGTALRGPRNEQAIVAMEVVKQMLDREVSRCTPELAALLEAKLKPRPNPEIIYMSPEDLQKKSGKGGE